MGPVDLGVDGRGTRMADEALEPAFRELRLPKRCGEVLAIDTSTANLHNRVGFTQEGLFR